jgi:hypothetical protein
MSAFQRWVPKTMRINPKVATASANHSPDPERAFVDITGTTFRVAYRKPRDSVGLAASGFSKEADATSTQIVAFLTVARGLANDKARQLGWIF